MINNKIIIGLVGAKGAGKTTAFNIIKALRPDAVELTLAKPLKLACAATFGIPFDSFELPALKEKTLSSPVFLTKEAVEKIFKLYDLTPDYDKYVRPHIGKILNTPREIAQYVGTEVLRNFEHGIHCRKCIEDDNWGYGVVTDIRFPNELEYFQRATPLFFPVYIKNTAAENAASSDTHESERHLPDLAKKAIAIVENTYNPTQFRLDIIKLLEKLEL